MINLIQNQYLLNSVASLYINPVSCDGISQHDLAREFKKHMTKTVYHWELVCDFPMKRGHIYTFKNVVFFPIREKHKGLADKELIEINLPLLHHELANLFGGYIKHLKNGVNMPALGCDTNGGLDYEGWFKPLIFKLFEKEDYTINLFEPK